MPIADSMPSVDPATLGNGLRELVAVADEPLLIVDCATRWIVEANPAACRMYELTREQLLDRDFGSMFSDAHYLDDIFAAHRDHVPLRFHRGRNGRRFPVEMSLRYFSTESGEFAALSVRDIRERLERERLDSESERKYKSLFEASPYPILILNAHGAVIDANACAEHCYRYDYKELTALDWQTLDPSSPAPQFSARPTMLGVREHHRKDGSTFIAEVMLSYFRLPSQSLILALVRDVTEYRQTFMQLQESEARWRFAIEGSGDAIVDLSLEANGTSYISPVLGEMLGYCAGSEKALSAEEWMARVHTEDRGRLREAMDHHLDGLSAMVMDEHRLREKSGQYRWVSFRAKVISGGRHGPRLIGAVRDIHDLRMRTQQENAARAKLFRLERMATAGEMLSALAHEVNQPLTAISNFSALAIRQLNQPAPPEKISRSLSVISEQAMRAGEIVRRIREFVRRGEPNVDTTNINTLLARVAGWLHNEATAANVAVSLDLAPDLPDIGIDILQIEQVVFNLLRNAIEAMASANAEPRPLVVSSRIDSDSISVHVRDQGRGLDESMLDVMFEPFVSSKAQGMGMGLAICRTIVEAHGGYIRAENNGHEPGAHFSFALPLSSVLAKASPGGAHELA